ncbi:peptidylprolyl isomerase [Vibrio sp. WJH972]
MMDRLREGANSIAIKVILGLIMVSFVFAGVGNYLVGGGNNSAAEVAGVKISLNEFEQAYQNERSRMQSQLGDYFSNLLADPSYVASFRRSILDRMVNDVLLEEHAKTLGLSISDDQVRKAILEMPSFQSDGKFDQEIYQAALRRAGYSADSFAAYLRSDLLRQQLVGAVEETEFALLSEAQAQGLLLSQTRTIKTVAIKQNSFAEKVTISDEEVESYYNTHPQEFTRPEQFKLAYLLLSAEGLKQTIEVTDEEANLYYEEHIEQYSTKAQRRVSHILIQGDDQSVADAVLAKVNQGADFAELAASESQDPGSKDSGGDLGWIEKGVMDADFESAAFALANVGDVSGVVKSNFGYHIIKLLEDKPAQAKPLSDVKDEVIALVKDQKAVDTFYELQTELEKVAFEFPDSLEESAKVTGAGVVQTDFVSINTLPAELSSNAVVEAINHPEVKEDQLNSNVIQLAPESVVVVRVDELRPETVLPIEEVKSTVESELTASKAEAAAKAFADKILAQLKDGNQEGLAENELSFGEEEVIDRNSPLAEAIYALKKPIDGEHVYAQATSPEGEILLVELLDVNAENNDELNEQLMGQLERLNSQQDIAGLVSVLRTTNDIEYHLSSE